MKENQIIYAKISDRMREKLAKGWETLLYTERPALVFDHYSDFSQKFRKYLDNWWKEILSL
jgi:hypothetical protein